MKKTSLILILLLFFFGCVEKSTAMDLFLEGRSLNSKDPELALEKLTEAIHLDENFSEAYEWKSEILLNMEKYYEAELNALRAIEIWPDNHRAYIDLFLIYYEKGDLDKSLFYLREAEKINPYDIYVNSNLARYYFITAQKTGDCQKAIPYAKKYLKTVIANELMNNAIKNCESKNNSVNPESAQTG